MLKDGALNKKGMQVLNWALVAVIVVVVANILTKVLKAAKLASVAAGDAAGGVIIQQATGITINRQAYLRQIAADIDAEMTYFIFTHYIMLFRPPVVVNLLNACLTPAEVVFVCEKFKQISGNSIKNDVVSRMLDVSTNKLSQVVKLNIK